MEWCRKCVMELANIGFIGSSCDGYIRDSMKKYIHPNLKNELSKYVDIVRSQEVEIWNGVYHECEWYILR